MRIGLRRIGAHGPRGELDDGGSFATVMLPAAALAMHPYDFSRYVRGLPPSADRRTLARLALNTVHDPDDYPLDLSCVLTLADAHRCVALGFLDACATDPRYYQSTPPEHTEWLRREVLLDAEKAP